MPYVVISEQMFTEQTMNKSALTWQRSFKLSRELLNFSLY